MIPELQVNDIITVERNYLFEEVQIGDIIVFNKPSDPNKVIVHRVVEITNNDPKTLRTQGDANRSSLQGTDFPITEKEYIGKVSNVIPEIGGINNFLDSLVTLVWIIQLGILAIPIILHIQFRRNNPQSSILDNKEQ